MLMSHLMRSCVTSFPYLRPLVAVGHTVGLKNSEKFGLADREVAVEVAQRRELGAEAVLLGAQPAHFASQLLTSPLYLVEA